MAHDYYCVIKSRDPEWNPGYIPCPDAEIRNCEGCFIKDEADRKAAKRKDARATPDWFCADGEKE